MSSPIGASPYDGVESLAVRPVEVSGELAALIGAHLGDVGVDEAVAALNQTVAEEVSDVGGRTPRHGGRCWHVGGRGCGS